MSQHKSLCSLLAAVFLCMAMFIFPVTANAESSEGLTLSVVPSTTTASLGENISYNYVITSTCNTTVDSLVLTDDKFGTISLPVTSLASGENISVSLHYTVLAADFPGPIPNTATVSGISADNATLSTNASASVTLNAMTSSLSVDMSASTSSACKGDIITYTYTINNTGQTGLNTLTLTDSRLGAITLVSDNLSVGDTITATSTYTVLEADLPGPLSSSATATAASSTGESVTATSETVSVTLNLTSSLSVSMSASTSSARKGDIITYTYTVNNSGQAYLSSIVLTDSRLGDIALSSDNLSAGGTITATKTYTVLSADFPGQLTSTADAKATSSTGAAVSATSEIVTVSLTENNPYIGDNRTKAEILIERGVPGKGISHAPGLQKPFNPNFHGWGNGSDNNTGNYGNDNNGQGQGNGNGNGKNKGNK